MRAVSFEGVYDPSVMKIGIRREDKSKWEARIPLVPEHLGALQRDEGLTFAVQPSDQRAFSTDELEAVGVTVADDLSDCPIIMGVKEIPTSRLEPSKTYVFFSHTIKGQPYNMAMLRRLMNLGCNLIDYERIVNDAGQRLVFFGVHAGLAGMIDTLWAFGQRLAKRGLETPLADLKQALHYRTLSAAENHLRAVADRCRDTEALASLGPVIIGVTGNGRVSQGAQQICDLLTPETLRVAELANVDDLEDGAFYKVVFEEAEMFARKDGGEFNLQEYYDHPELYDASFAKHLPQLTMLVNCIYWEERYPRLVTKEGLQNLFASGTPKLEVIGDISCDIEGSIEATVRPTDPGTPVYVYDVDKKLARDGFDGRGPVIMAVDILPTELPRDASQAFSEALKPLMPGLAAADPSGSFDDWNLPAPLKKAVILHKGKLTPPYAYMAEYL